MSTIIICNNTTNSIISPTLANLPNVNWMSWNPIVYLQILPQNLAVKKSHFLMFWKPLQFLVVCNILVLKIRKSKICRGSIDSRCRGNQRSTFTSAWKGDCLCWSGGGGNQQRHSVRRTGWPLVISNEMNKYCKLLTDHDFHVMLLQEIY